MRTTPVGSIIIVLAACIGCVIWASGSLSARQGMVGAKPIDWQAITPAPDAPLRPWRTIMIHHSAAPTGSTQSIDHDHKQRADGEGGTWDGIGYHFVIGNGHGMSLGQIDATFRWLHQRHGAHAGNDDYNQFGIGIVLVGDLDHQAPPGAQLERCAHLCALLISRLRTLTVDAIIGHRDVKSTACPGRYMNLALLRKRVEELLHVYEQQLQSPLAGLP